MGKSGKTTISMAIFNSLTSVLTSVEVTPITFRWYWDESMVSWEMGDSSPRDLEIS